MSNWINVCGVAVRQLNLALRDQHHRPDVMVICRANVVLTSADQCRELARYFEKAAEAFDEREKRLANELLGKESS